MPYWGIGQAIKKQLLLYYMKLLITISFSLLICAGYAQQIAHAKDVQLVSTPGTKIVSQGSIKFTGTTNWKDSGTTYILTNPVSNLSHWVDSTATGVLDANSQGTVIFNNYINNQQLIGPTTFYNLKIAGSGITMYQSNQVKNTLALDTGLVYFNNAADSIYVTSPITSAISSSSAYAKSWVHGKLSRQANVTGPPEYLFPVGKINGTDSLYAPVKIEKFNTANATYTAAYFPATPFDNLNILNPPLDHISQVEYWEVYSNAGTPNADAKLSLSWRGYSRVSSNPFIRDSLLIAQYIFNPAGRWEATGGGYQAAVSGADSLSGWVKHNTQGASYTYAERRFTLGTYSKWNSLPLQLLYWTAVADGNKVRLNWNVEQEQDVVKYDVEKSLNGTNFYHLLSTTSLQKAAWLYTEYDYNPVIGWNYYRLKITDKANKVTYAGIRKVKFEKGLQIVSVFPNPAVDYVNIIMPSSYAGNVRLQLFAVDGKFMNELKPTTPTVRLNVQPLAAGTYYIKLINGEEIKTYPFVKQ